LAYIVARLEAEAEIQSVVGDARFDRDTGLSRLGVEPTDYVAAAILMPYNEILELAELTRYDIDRIVSAFCATYEQVGHRLATLNADKRAGVPFFFLRMDRAGNVVARRK